MTREPVFHLHEFMPYLLNQAADAASQGFGVYYKSKYGMLRTEWRVVFHIGRYGRITAKEICDRANVHKTKVSRAVRALETKGFVKRTPLPEDRRHETLELTPRGLRAFQDLCTEAEAFDAKLLRSFSDEEKQVLRRMLNRIRET